MRLNKQWRLARRPVGLLKRDDFEWREEPLPALGSGEVLFRNIYLSIDPASRTWTNSAESYVPPIAIGDLMRCGSIAVVEQSNNPAFSPGQYVSGRGGWQQYVISNGDGWTPLPIRPNLPLTIHFGLLSHIGPTAYFGLLNIGQPQPGETLVVSAAAGAVGSIVGQIGRIKGCRVVGIAGSDEKCDWLTSELGFDAAINYKTTDVSKALKAACPNGIDIYFDNVGGSILDAVLAQAKQGARIPVCGMVSQYNATESYGVCNLPLIIGKRIKLQGFIVYDFIDEMKEATEALLEWHRQGKLNYRVHVEHGLENAPDVLNMLFEGKNRGKLVLQISAE